MKLTVDELVLGPGDIGNIDVVGRGGELFVFTSSEDLFVRRRTRCAGEFAATRLVLPAQTRLTSVAIK